MDDQGRKWNRVDDLVWKFLKFGFALGVPVGIAIGFLVWGLWL